MIVERCMSKKDVTKKLLELFTSKVTEYLKTEDIIQVAIATGNTFSAFLKKLGTLNLPFNRMDLFVIDEYAGISFNDERSCSIDLCRDLQIIDKFHSIHFFDTNLYYDQISYYNVLLDKAPLDIILLGIGSDGHFAFCNKIEDHMLNKTYSIVDFSDDEITAQVNAGWFPTIDLVPKKGITITKYGVLKCKTVIIAGFYKEKQEIINKILTNSVPEEKPIYEILQRNDIIFVYG